MKITYSLSPKTVPATAAASESVVEYSYDEFQLDLPTHWCQIPTPHGVTFNWYSQVEAATITISADFYEMSQEKTHLFAERSLSSRLEALQQSSAKPVAVLHRSIKPHSTGVGLELGFGAEVEGDCIYLYSGHVTSRKIFNFTLVCEPDKIAAAGLYNKLMGNIRVKLP